MKNAIDAGYRPASPGWLDKIVTTQRRRLFDSFQAFAGDDPADKVLSVGVAPNALFDKPDYLSDWSEPGRRARITSYQVDAPRFDVRGTSSEFRLPFRDGEFDWVFCNEVIEHAGGFERQFAVAKEMYRVARKGVFLTTPNRRHPLEFHTGLPLIHLLPPSLWRRLLRLTGKGRWASESVLNPVDSAALYRIAGLLPGVAEHDVGHKRIAGIKAHFFLMLSKARPAESPRA